MILSCREWTRSAYQGYSGAPINASSQSETLPSKRTEAIASPSTRPGEVGSIWDRVARRKLASRPNRVKELGPAWRLGLRVALTRKNFHQLVASHVEPYAAELAVLDLEERR